MLSTKLSYKYHIYAHCVLYEIPINRILYLKYHVKYTGLVQSYTWNYFHSIFLRNLMFTMLSTQISYKYHICAQCILQEIHITRILHLKLPCTYTEFRSILYLDVFSVHLTIESHVTMLSTKILVQSYTWIHFYSIFLLNLMFSMLSTQISYKYHIYSQCSYKRYL